LRPADEPLRGTSFDTRRAPSATITTFDGLEAVPVFNQDLEDSTEDPGVRLLRQQLAEADELLIATPEDSQSIPGSGQEHDRLAYTW
jgi:NAD(P)H-dependent FMN reductase